MDGVRVWVVIKSYLDGRDALGGDADRLPEGCAGQQRDLGKTKLVSGLILEVTSGS
jgi:hypothetical protein